jgi:hypothetical protein
MAECYKCKFRGTVSGSAHSSCNFIREANPEDANVLMLESLLASHQVKMTGKIEEQEIDLVEMNPHGIKNGWCHWPLNFDPVWIDKCAFYQEKELVEND